MRRMLLALLFLLAALAPAHAQEQRCFNTPGISDCISGRFLEYWDQNGGLAVFGYPLTPARRESTANGTFLVQYFERQRFELHPENAAPYDVLLGLLGGEIYTRTSGDWRSLPSQAPSSGCEYFAETRHTLCEPFLSYWRSHGLQDAALDSHGRSLMLLGMPLTTPRLERNPDGDTVMTQWFERARLEDHGSQGVLLGRLGAELLGRSGGVAPPPANSADATAILAAINRERTSRGLTALTLNDQLSAAAQAHSDDMARNNFFSHTGSDGSSAGDRIARTGYPARAWGENIAAGFSTPADAMQAWMNSEGHRANILNPTYRELGVGRADNAASTYGIYWTTEFGSR